MMDFPIHIETILYFKGHIYNFLNYDVDMSLAVELILANSADQDVCPSRCFQNTQG